MLKFLALPAAFLLIATSAHAAPGGAPSDQPAPAQPAPAAKPDRAPPDRTTGGIMRYDTNKDGWVDRAEWTAGQEGRVQPVHANGDRKLSQGERFRRTPAGGTKRAPRRPGA